MASTFFTTLMQGSTIKIVLLGLVAFPYAKLCFDYMTSQNEMAFAKTPEKYREMHSGKQLTPDEVGQYIHVFFSEIEKFNNLKTQATTLKQIPVSEE